MDLEDDAIEGYQNILQEFKENPEYAENSNYLHEAIKQRKWSSDDGSFNVFTEILGAINALGNNESEEVILLLLDSCEDHNVANQLVLTLGYVGGTKSVSRLRGIIFNHDMKSMPQDPST
jgi:hypothetical protein